MNRDAKIGVVVILIIVGVLVVIWGRGGANNEQVPPGDAIGKEQKPVMPPANIDVRPDRAGTAASGADTRTTGTEGARVVSNSTSSTPPVSSTGTVAGTTTPPVSAPVDPIPTKPEVKYWTYTVGEGDMLFLVAREQLGDGNRWKEIADLNKLVKPYTILVGQKLKMPPKEAAPAATTPAVTPAPASETHAATADTAPAAAGTRKYVVKSGDGLILIAREQLHDAKKWQKIAEMNHLTKNDILKPGQVLLLPE